MYILSFSQDYIIIIYQQTDNDKKDPTIIREALDLLT